MMIMAMSNFGDNVLQNDSEENPPKEQGAPSENRNSLSTSPSKGIIANIHINEDYSPLLMNQSER